VCGISDYTDLLAASLRKLVDVTYVLSPESVGRDLNDVDLIHIQHEYFVFGGVAPWKVQFPRFIAQVRRPVVMTVHEIVTSAGNPAKGAAIRLSNKLHFASPRIRRHIVHTELDKTRLATVIGESRPIEVVRLAVPEPPVLPDRAESRRELELDERFVLTIFGFISRKKGHLLALQALELLPADFTLLIAGGRHPDDSTDYVERLRETARALGRRARITEYLSRQDILTVMAATDLILAPFSESSGSASLAEAFACGLPVLASDIAPHEEILRDTPGSIAIIGRSPRALADSLLELRSDATRLQSLREGAARYAKRHSHRVAAEATIRLYERTLEESRT
jgi:glycosyltransferase involved in cell wall biosynthesis